MHVRFLLGPAGSGKTFRVLKEIRESLASNGEGPALILLAPKQTTYQLERQLLADASIPGYTRLQILSFERLSHFIFDHLQIPSPEMLNEEGRVMVLRGLLAKKRDKLKLFRASSRLTGFAQELSAILSELQRNQQSPETLQKLAEQAPAGLAGKLRDFAMLLQDYLDWLTAHHLQDADTLVQSAAKTLAQAPRPGSEGSSSRPFNALWVDGFGEWTHQEIELLATLVPHCERATVTFCLDRIPAERVSWLSVWSVVRRSYEDLRKRLERLPEVDVRPELLLRDPNQTRFSRNSVLQHLEQFWPTPQPYLVVDDVRSRLVVDDVRSRLVADDVRSRPVADDVRSRSPSPPIPTQEAKPTSSGQLEWLWAAPTEPRVTSKKAGAKSRTLTVQHPATAPVPLPESVIVSPSAAPPETKKEIQKALRVATCVDPEAEAILAAREILEHVRSGGRFREAAVLVRDLSSYARHLERIFSRYEIPFFMDRRESMGHHPLAELTRSALRTLVFRWKHEEWFSVLKTGLVPVHDEDIDLLENETLARGWNGPVWLQPLRINEQGRTPVEHDELRKLEQRLEALRKRIVPPFEHFSAAMQLLHNKPSGRQLAAAFRLLWEELDVEKTLEQWAAVPDPGLQVADAVHATLWEQINLWLKNLELAFPAETLSLRDWLPIVDAGLSTLTVGIIPPALDQVLVGTIDRSRNPDAQLALVLGMNENVFPSPAQASPLLTEMERETLERQGLALGSSSRQHLGRERYLAYIACTRARSRVVFTSALHDPDGSPLHPSPFLSQIKHLFPALEFQTVPRAMDWREGMHATELVEPLLRHAFPENAAGSPHVTQSLGKMPAANNVWSQLATVPSLAKILGHLRDFHIPTHESLSLELARKIYGTDLHTSVSRMERFGSCPFQFFVHSGLKAEDRKLFEFDNKEQGSFQHDVLARFHQHLREEKKRWRDISPQDARDLIAQIASSVAGTYRDGLTRATEQSRFTTRALTESLQDFVETIVGWMQGQYQFDPVEVELPFGDDPNSPAWRIPLKTGGELALYGRIDRIDLFRKPGTDEACCVVVDYKSHRKQLDPVLMAHGIQLQLPAYLNVLRNWPEPRALFGVDKLLPAGVFYVNLKGSYGRARHRTAALTDAPQARKLAYRHIGRFDMTILKQLDHRPDAVQGDQFNYRLTDAGEVYKNCKDPMRPGEFQALLDSTEASLKKMAHKIFSGSIEVAPYRKGWLSACDQCDFLSICRIDPWTHRYRVLQRTDEPEPDDEV